MIDFAALLAEQRARMSPEERERFDAAVAAREAIEATEHPIPAVFEVLGWKRPSGLAALKDRRHRPQSARSSGPMSARSRSASNRATTAPERSSSSSAR